MIARRETFTSEIGYAQPREYLVTVGVRSWRATTAAHETRSEDAT